MRAPNLINCNLCGYGWFTKSVKRYVTCPNCHYKIKNPYEEKINKEAPE